MDRKRITRLEDVPKGHWVVVTADHTRVIAHDADLEKALAKAEESGERDGVFLKAINLDRFVVAAVR